MFEVWNWSIDILQGFCSGLTKNPFQNTFQILLYRGENSELRLDRLDLVYCCTLSPLSFVLFYSWFEGHSLSLVTLNLEDLQDPNMPLEYYFAPYGSVTFCFRPFKPMGT